MPTTLLCPTQTHSGDTKTYVSVGELKTPTMLTGKIGIIMSETNPVIEPPSQDRDTVTSFLEANVLPLGHRVYMHYRG